MNTTTQHGQPPSFDALDTAQVRATIRRALLIAVQVPTLRPSHDLESELRTFQRIGSLPGWVTIEQFRQLWAEVERALEHEVHADRADRRAGTA